MPPPVHHAERDEYVCRTTTTRRSHTLVCVGPVFKSATKPRDFLAGLEYAAAAAREIALPKVAISGIGPENVDKVLAAGISAVAVTAAVTGADDVAAAAREIKNRLVS